MKKAVLIALIAAIFFSLILATTGSAQTILTVFKKDKPIATFQRGDKIRFKLKGERFYMEKVITGFDYGRITFHYFDLSLDEIEMVDTRGKRKDALAVISALTIRAAIIFMAADTFNQGVIRNEGFEPSEPSLIIGGSLLSTSIISNFLSKRKLNVSKQRFRLTII